VRIGVKVITRAKKEGIEKALDGSYKIKVSLPPEKLKANKRVIELLSEEFGVKKKDIRIISGETSGKKIIEIGS